MYVIGISAYYHDSSVSLFKNGTLIFACEEEKFTGIKHDSSFPHNALKYVYDRYEIKKNEIDAVCYYENPNLKLERVIKNIKKNFYKSPIYSITSYFQIKKTIKKIDENLRKISDNIFYSEHHLSHQYYSFFSSEFNNGICLSIDGVGEFDTTGMGFADRGGIVYQSISKYPHSLGLFYSAMTSFLGFKPNEGEYKVMGLASYGNSSRYIDKVRKLIKFDDYQLKCDLKIFCWDRSNTTMFTSKLAKHLNLDQRLPGDKITKHHEDLAAAVQKRYEEILFDIITSNDLKGSNLCLSGGSAYNGTANGKLVKALKLKDLWIPLAPSDAGSSIGACVHYLKTHSELNIVIPKNPFLGPDYDYTNYIQTIDKTKIKKFDENDLIDYVAKQLNDGRIIGWYQGRCEFGARALGNRSILANPMIKGMRDKINDVIKKRERFRPFAPMVTKDKQHEYFFIQNDIPYMNQVVQVKSKYKKILSEITHVDGSARVQTLLYPNSKIYRLVKKFETFSDHPVLLNTSFNIKDKTIVLTPQDAIETFYNTELDILVIGNYVITK